MYRDGMISALFCTDSKYSSYEFQKFEGGGFVGPFISKAAGNIDYLCPSRILKDQTIQSNYDPSFLDGRFFEEENIGSLAFFGDDKGYN